MIHRSFNCLLQFIINYKVCKEFFQKKYKLKNNNNAEKSKYINIHVIKDR